MKQTYTLRKPAVAAIRAGRQVLSPEDLTNEIFLEEGQVVSLMDGKGDFVAKSYLGLQNKGIGWVIGFDPSDDLTLDYFYQLFQRAIHKRQSYFVDQETTAFRLYNGEGDGLGGLTIDYYQGYLVLSWYSLGIYLYKDLVLQALLALLPDCPGAVDKVRFPNEADLPDSQWIYGQEPQGALVIKENGISYATYLNEGLMTGIFLDQREVRKAIRDHYAKDKSILNTFSYTGAFSLAAAMGGASHTTSVDVANRSLEKTREQFSVNGLDWQDQAIYVMDVFDYIKYAVKKGLTFDTLVVDPPSFARTKKRTFSVAKNYSQLVESLQALVAPGGTMVLSTNASNIRLQQFQEMIEKGLATSGRTWKILDRKGLPADFAINGGDWQSDYLKVFFVGLDQ